jgi:hypothetical protein
MELVAEFFLPLLGKMRRAQHGQTLDFAAVQEFASDEQGLDRLANANVVGDQ